MGSKSAGKFHLKAFAVIVLLVMITDVILFARIGAFSKKTFDTSIDLSSAETVVTKKSISAKSPAETEQTFQNRYASDIGEEFFVSDNKQVWSTSTSIELFKSEYINGENTITARSSNGEKIIAPGTENSYTFSVTNDKKTAVDYNLKTQAVLSDGENEIEIPIKVKLYNYKGEYIAGSQNEWAAADALNSVDYSSVLGSGRYENFTLDWKWDFEADGDDFDTYLGDLAAEKPLTCKIQIDVLTADSDKPHSGEGNPNTGFEFNSQNFGIIAISLLIIALVYSMLNRKTNEAENEK